MQPKRSIGPSSRLVVLFVALIAVSTLVLPQSANAWWYSKQTAVWQDGYIRYEDQGSLGSITQCISAKASWDNGAGVKWGNTWLKPNPRTTADNACGAKWEGIPVNKQVTFEIFAKSTGASWTSNRVKTGLGTWIGKPAGAESLTLSRTSMYPAHGSW